jgi:hypothetical protein
MSVPANYVFLPWVRQGAAAGIQVADMTAGQPGVVSVSVKLQVNDDLDQIDQAVRLYGPGDVIGIDPRQVVRTDPRHLSVDFEPNYFPAIEFDHPDFPWLFTPAKADDKNRLRPWLCLVVIRKQDGVTVSQQSGAPLPVLEITEPARPENELPDLSESWAWAHAQVANAKPEQGSLTQSLSTPALNVSRLLCPRRLDQLTEYWACVVPTFELGRKSGLGLPIQRDEHHNEEANLEPAWLIKKDPPTQPATPLRLPVYYSWEFRTGLGGDFEALAGKLKARIIPKTVGKKQVDISHAFGGQPPVIHPEGATLELQGALRVVKSGPAGWPTEDRLAFQTALQTILNTAWKQSSTESNGADHDPILGPPIYGSWQAARHTVNVDPATAPFFNWLDELNLDPRHRAVASLGTTVIQTQQEQLMASAWEQIGDIKRINQLRRQAQLGLQVNTVYHTKHFNRFSAEAVVRLLAPAQYRVVVAPTTTLEKRSLFSSRISRSAIPPTAVSAPLRRLTSERGQISVRFQAKNAAPINILKTLNNVVSMVPPEIKRAGWILLDDVTEQATIQPGLKSAITFREIFNTLDSGPQLGRFQITDEAGTSTPLVALLPIITGVSPLGMPDSADAAAFRAAAKEHFDYVVNKALLSFLTAPAPPLDLSQTKRALLQSIKPQTTIAARLLLSQTLDDGSGESFDPLEPIVDAPVFPQPMYEALRDVSQDFLFPGLEDVPANSVTVLETNPEFVESFMVGLNAEMSHELLWRDYPTDQRGTYFGQFWDTSVNTGQPDIDHISQWNNNHLGDNTPRASGKLVLLIRGDLLRRYPNSVIYAVPAFKNAQGKLDFLRQSQNELHPLFRGTLKPDVTFLGFNLTDAQALGDPPNDPNGYFFVIQQQPTEPRFGMDEADYGPPEPPALVTWNDLSWRHLAQTEQELKKLSYASVTTVLPDINKAKWGVNSNSAHHAYITVQRPVRIAIHAQPLLRHA